MKFWILYVDPLDKKEPHKEAFIEAKHQGDMRRQFFDRKTRHQYIAKFRLLNEISKKKDVSDLKEFGLSNENILFKKQIFELSPLFNKKSLKNETN